jgi:hypothetical protein
VYSSTRMSAIDVLGQFREMLGPHDAENAVVGYLNDNVGCLNNTEVLSLSRGDNTLSLSEGPTGGSLGDRYPFSEFQATAALAMALRAETGPANIRQESFRGGDNSATIQKSMRTILDTATSHPAPVVRRRESSRAPGADLRPAAPAPLPSLVGLQSLPLSAVPLPVPPPYDTDPRTRNQDTPQPILRDPAFTARTLPRPSPPPQPASGNGADRSGGEAGGGSEGVGAGLKRAKVRAGDGGGSGRPMPTHRAGGGGGNEAARMDHLGAGADGAHEEAVH